MKTLVYKAETEADWIRIVGKALKEGKNWCSGKKEMRFENWKIYKKDSLIYIDEDIRYGNLNFYNEKEKSYPNYIPMWKEKKPETLSKICRDIWSHKLGFRSGERRIKKLI